MTAGVGHSGDLTNPRVSLPRGTLGATLVGRILYVFIVIKLSWAAPPELLNQDQPAMARIAAVWGPIIMIGLGAATLSSAIGSVLVAPRTLQALGGDGTFPSTRSNHWLAAGNYRKLRGIFVSLFENLFRRQRITRIGAPSVFRIAPAAA